MATVAQTGLFSDTATWVGGSVPSAGEAISVPTGLILTFDDARTTGAWQIQGTGKISVTGTGRHTFTADSEIVGATTPGNRYEVAAGGVMEGSPGSSGTLTVWLGGTTETNDPIGYPTIGLNGAAGNRAVIRKKAGDAGAFQVRPAIHGSFGSNRGAEMLVSDYGYIKDLSLLWTHHVNTGVRLRFVNSEFDGGIFRARATTGDNTGATNILLEDSRFTSWEPTDPGFHLILDGERDRSVGQGGSTVRRCSIRARTWIGTLQESGNGLGLLMEDCAVFKAGVALGDDFDFTLANKAVFRRFFFFGGDDSVGYNLVNLRGEIEDAYAHIDYRSNTAGNPHYFAAYGGAVLRRVTIDYTGYEGLDAGDPFSVQAGTASEGSWGGEAIEPIAVKGTPRDGVSSVYPGTWWALSANGSPEFPGGRLRVTRGTINVPQNGSAFSFTHAPYSGPGHRQEVNDTIVWSDAPGGAFARDEQTEAGQAMSPDMILGARNHGWNLGTFETNLVAGVPTSRYGLRAVKVTAVENFPAINALGSAPGFADPSRNFVSWCRTQRGHTGTDEQVTDAALDEIFADPPLANALRTWVRAGYVPSNAELLTANGGTEYAGAMQPAGSAVSVTLLPATADVFVHGEQQFTASVSGHANQAVTWSKVSGPGAIDSDGMFTVGLVEGTTVIRATSVADPSAFDEATITVTHPYKDLIPADTGSFLPVFEDTGEPNPDYVASDYFSCDMGSDPFLPLRRKPRAVHHKLVTPCLNTPVHAKSDDVMAAWRPGGDIASQTVRTDTIYAPGFPTSVFDDGVTPFVPVSYGGGEAEAILARYSHPGATGWPLPPGARVQGKPYPYPHTEDPGGDGHIILLGKRTGRVFEGYRCWKDPDEDRWWMGNGWCYNILTGNWEPGVDESDPRHVPPETQIYPVTMVNGAGLPMLLLTGTWHELYTHGWIGHALGCTFSNNKINATYVDPAVGAAYMNIGRIDNGDQGLCFPYGARFKLRPAWYRANVHDFVIDEDGFMQHVGEPIGTWGEGCRVLLRCFAEFGLINTDGGAQGAFWMQADSRFHEQQKWVLDLNRINEVPLGEFEMLAHEEPYLAVTQEPEVAPAGQTRRFKVETTLWDVLPNAHRGDPSITYLDNQGNLRRPWAYYAALRDEGTKLAFGYAAPGEVTEGDGHAVLLTPERPFGYIDATVPVGRENPRIIPTTVPIGMFWWYYDGAYVAWTTEVGDPIVLTIAPDPAVVAPGGTIQFSVDIHGTSATTGIWTYEQIGAAAFNYDTGLYTALNQEGTGRIRFRLREDQLATATLEFTVSASGGGGGGGVAVGAGGAIRRLIQARMRGC
jgi:hypothetical protein